MYMIITCLSKRGSLPLHDEQGHRESSKLVPYVESRTDATGIDCVKHARFLRQRKESL
jgi:hypothetical protein